MHSDGKKRRSFLALLFAAGDLRRWKEIIMINILKEKNGMNVGGQGGKIILFMLPFLIAAVWVDVYIPDIKALPFSISSSSWDILPISNSFFGELMGF